MPINSGDTAWLLGSAALVMLMTPGLAFFYGGMVRRKNILSTLMMNFIMLGVGGIIWVLWGYSLAFAPDVGGFIGNLNFIGLRGVGETASRIYATTTPQLAFMIFQAMFAIISVALITGSVVGRIKFNAIMVFAVAWLTIVYSPVAHWVWGAGWLAKMGVLDFAGGTVVHIDAGASALALAMLLGKQKGFKKEGAIANNIPFVLLGTGLLWFGWFGFNAGSALTAGGLASNAFVATNIAAASAGLTWMFLDWHKGKPTILGAATGSVVGLVAITPAAGFVTPLAGIPIGIVASFVSYYSRRIIKQKMGVDDALDVFACHGLGSIWGMLATGIFASIAINASGANGAIAGNWMLIVKQMVAILAVGAYAFIVTMIIGKVIIVTMKA